MAPILINRAPWNALVDDPGNNLEGTPWTKAQIKAVLLDPIDVALADADDGTTKDAAQDAAIAAIAPAAGQLKFPAAQNPSADPNVLDDYEEGSFSIALIGSGGQSGQAYSSQAGVYTKVGKLVSCAFILTLSALGTFTGTVKLTGFPFPPDAGLYTSGVVMWNFLTASFVNVVFVNEPAAITALLRGAKAAAPNNATDFIQTDLSATSTLIGSVTYRST